MIRVKRRKRVPPRKLLIEALPVRSMLAVINVDSDLDNFDANAPMADGQVTLREAILAANGDVPVGDALSGSGADTIEFAAGLNGATIALNPSFGQLTITQPVAVDASSLSNGLTVDAQGNSRIFNITTWPAMGEVVLSRLTLKGGHADDFLSGGGAIFLYGDRLILQDSLVTENTATITSGGGIFLSSYSTAWIGNSTIVGNAALRGGGIYLERGSSASLTNSTITGNSTMPFGVGGGLYTYHGSFILENSTVTGNMGESGGGIVSQQGVSLVLKNSIIANNTSVSGNGDLVANFVQSFASNYSLIGSTNGLPPNVLAQLNAGVGNVLNTSPLLGPLADHGGPTMTHALLAGSPAIDAGDPSAVAGVGDTPLFDQRGMPFGRVEDGNNDLTARIDMGAFEVPPSATVDGDFNDDGHYDCLDIDGLIAEVAAGTHNPAFDLTGDTLVDLLDRDAWLIEAGMNNPSQTGGNPFLLADANLDGVVDGSDFGVWNANKFTLQAVWCSGDFTADGAVDGSDFSLWNAHKFTSSLAQIATPVSTIPPSRGDRVHLENRSRIDPQGLRIGSWFQNSSFCASRSSDRLRCESPERAKSPSGDGSGGWTPVRNSFCQVHYERLARQCAKELDLPSLSPSSFSLPSRLGLVGTPSRA